MLGPIGQLAKWPIGGFALNADRREKPRKAGRVTLDPDLHRVLSLRRVDTGEPIQGQVNAILREHLIHLGLVESQPEPAAAS